MAVSEIAEQKEQGVYKLIGEYNKFSIPKKTEVLTELFRESPPIRLDLSAVVGVDSALLALLVELKRAYPTIEFTHINDTLHQLLELYQVKDLLL